MKYLGIDYGKKKVGLAISEGQLASPFKVVLISNLSDALLQIKKIILDQNIDELVIGTPESGQARAMVKKFISEIKKEITVSQTDETLSSYKAKAIMIEIGKKRKSYVQDDAYSAALILQNYLDTK